MKASLNHYLTELMWLLPNKMAFRFQKGSGVITANSLEDVKNDSQPFSIGGGEIYKQAMAIADKIEITRVYHDFEADTIFPKIDASVWKEVNNTFHKKDKDNDYEFSFLTYEKK